MSHKLTLRVVGLAALVAVGLCIYSYSLVKLEWMKSDDARLLAFAHQIDNADHIVVTYSLGTVNLLIAGEDVKKVLRAVSSSKSNRPPSGSKWKCDYTVKAAFLRGTNVVGEVGICRNVFLISHDQSPFRDDTGLLQTIVYEPASVAYFKEGKVK